MDEAARALTGPSSWSHWALTNSAGGALALTGGGSGGCRQVFAVAGVGGDVSVTYSDRSFSSWGAQQEPTNQSTEQLWSSTVMRRQLHGNTHDDL